MGNAAYGPKVRRWKNTDTVANLVGWNFSFFTRIQVGFDLSMFLKLKLA
jgi:hypothetical protein